jgi:LEA14-like dessication related protein
MKQVLLLRNFLLAAFSFVVVFQLSSCDELEPVEIVNIESAKIITMTAEKVEIELIMKLKNPNSMGFSVTGGDMDVQMGKVKLGNAHVKGKVRIPAHSEKSHTFKLAATPESLMSGGLSSLMALATKGNSDITVKGFIKVRAYGILSKKFPIDEKARVPMGGK